MMLGKWSNEHAVKSYVNGIPLGEVLAHVGFHCHLHLVPKSVVRADDELIAPVNSNVESLFEELQLVCHPCLPKPCMHCFVAAHGCIVLVLACHVCKLLE